MSLRFALSDIAKGFRRHGRQGDPAADREGRNRGRPRSRRDRQARRSRQHRRERLLPQMAERAAGQHLPAAGGQPSPCCVHLSQDPLRRRVRGRRCHRRTASPMAAAPNRSAAARTTDDAIAIRAFGRTACVRAAPRQPAAPVPQISLEPASTARKEQPGAETALRGSVERGDREAFQHQGRGAERRRAVAVACSKST